MHDEKTQFIVKYTFKAIVYIFDKNVDNSSV